MTIMSRMRSMFRADSGGWLDRIGSNFAGWRGGGNFTALDHLASAKGLAHRLTWMVPEDGVAKGWTTNTDSEKDETRLIDSKGGEAGLNVEGSLLIAGGSARQHGGSWLWPVSDADRDDWSRPRPPGQRDVAALHVLTADEVTRVDSESDPFEKNWSKMSVVSIQVNRQGAYYNDARVHTSWLIYVPGAPSPPSSDHGKKQGYDLSVLGLYREAICDYDSAGDSIARLMKRLAYFWVNVKDGKGIATGDEGEKFYEKMALLKDSMSTAGLLLLLGDDTAGWSGPSIAGTRDAMAALAERVSAIEGISLAIIFGQPPGGLSTDSASSQRAYNSLLQRWRRNIATPALLEFYDMALGPDDTRVIVWPDAETPSDIDVATASKIRADRDAVLIDRGVIEVAESSARFEGEDETALPVIADAEDDEGLDENEAPAESMSVEQLTKVAAEFAAVGDLPMANMMRAAIAELMGAEKPADFVPEDSEPRADAAGSEKVFLSVPLSPAALEQWKAVRSRVEDLLGPLEEPGGKGPHVTLLFMGDVAEESLPAVIEGAGEVAGDSVAFGYRAHRVASFEVTENSKGRTPIILQLDDWGFSGLNDALLRRLAKPMNADQFKRYEAHITIGMLDRALTPDERGALLEMPIELEGAAASIELAYGKNVVATYPLAAVRADTEDTK